MSSDPYSDTFLEDFLNLQWLRPESALWDAIAVRNCGFAIEGPSLDVGAGNGLFSFTCAGGALSHDYDQFLNAGHLDAFWENADIYDNYSGFGSTEQIVREPEWVYDFALDHKENLRRQADFLHLYGEYKIGDAAETWPFESESIKSLFSNMLYWLPNPEHCLSEVARVLSPGGRAFLCLQSLDFERYCPSYRSADWPDYARLLQRLNRRAVRFNVLATRD